MSPRVMERGGRDGIEPGHVSIDARAQVMSGKSIDSPSIDTTSVSSFKIFITHKLSLLPFLFLHLFLFYPHIPADSAVEAWRPLCYH